MSWKPHLPYGLAIIVLAVVTGSSYQESVDARARLKALADSAVTAKRRLDATAAALLAHVRSDSAQARNAEEAIHRKDGEIKVLGVAAATAVSRLAAQLTTQQQVLLDSIAMLDSTNLALVAAQRDSALVRFHRVAADRDSLMQLVASYQGQLTAVVSQLQQAARTPFFDSKPVRLALAVLAAKGATDLLQGR